MSKILFVGFATLDIIQGKKYPGGAAGAMSINASLLGVDSFLLTVLSRDKLGRYYIQKLKQAKVNLDLSHFSAPSIPTCVIKNPYSQGSKRIWNDNGSLPYFQKINPNKNKINQFKAIFFGNPPPSLAEKLALATNKRNIFYIPGPQSVLKKDYISTVILKKAWVVFGNEEEAPFIWKKKPFKFGTKLVVITKGKTGGSIYLKTRERINFKAPLVKKPLDPTGAGDGFALGFGLSLLKEESLPQAISMGKRLAAKLISQKGTVLKNKTL